MLKRIRIKNFKAWKDTGDIRIAPITVFFGTNSSGKTSLHQLLVVLKQTAESTDRQRVLHLGNSRTLVDVGMFSDVVFGHDTTEDVQFELAWERPSPLKVKDAKSEHIYESRALRFEATIGEDAKGRIKVRRMSYDLGDPKSGGLSIGMEPDAKGGGKYALTTSGYVAIRQGGRKWPLPPPSFFHGFPDEAVAYFQNTAFLADLTLDLDQLLSRLYYLGPLREYPKPLYTWSGEVLEHVGKTGGGAIEALLSATGRNISRAHKKRAEGFQVLVARWLRTMGLIHSFEARPIAEHRKEYEVSVRTLPHSPVVKLTDVGFGVSQVLPVIVECFYVPARSMVIFEQPEIHLHPRVQADLADLFAEAIRARENGEDRGVQLLIESHSEHLLRRLQLLIADPRSSLTHDDVAIYFCEPGPDGATIRELEVDAYGRIANWPKHFFGNAVGETGQQMRHMVARMRRGQDGS